MKKMFLAFSLIAGAYAAQAQVGFGVHANLIRATMETKSDDPDENIGDFKGRFSWKVGGVATIPLNEQFTFMPGLNVLSKGGKVDESRTEDIGGGQSVTANVKADAKLTYVELPLNFVFNSTNENGGFFIGIGPSVSFGLGGDLKGNVSASFGGQSYSESFNYDVKFDDKKQEDVDDENLHLKRLEIGANIIAGYKLANGLFFNAHYNHGLNDIDPNDGSETRNRYFGVGVGFFLPTR